jgi:hypothetical protein
VAILQISRITQRKGVLDDLPQPLAGAEFGWAVDQRRLFIGNGELAEGAPVVGNTEILTEFSDILDLAGTYTYSGLAATGYAVQTGTTTGDPVSLSLQNWLDQYASVKDFGAVGDGVTDDTAAINRALFQLYCRQNNTQIRRSLFFPAGTYLVTNTILVPPYAKLCGEGAESSIIQFQVEPWVTGTPYAEGVMTFYATNGLYYRSLSAVPVEDGDGNPILPTNTLYWEEQTLPEYVIRTADSLQQTGNDITSNGASRPTNVEVSSMAFKTANFGNDSALGHDILLVEDAEQVSFRQCSFDGPFTTADGDTSVDDLSAVKFASTLALVTRQVVFDDCKFSGCTYGFNTDQQVEAVTVSNSYFTTLTKGVVLGSLSPVSGGPIGFRIVHNIFDDVYSEGIVIQGVKLNATGYNIFLNVANGINASALAPVIDIDANNNVSVGDMFQRTTSQSATWPRVALNNSTSIALGMNIRGIAYTVDGASDDTVATEMQLGKYTRTAGVHSVLADNDSETLFVADTAVFKAFKMDYTIIRGTSVRTGSLVAVSAAAGTFSYSDDYSENASTGISFSVTEASPGGDITVAYTSTSTGSSGTIDYSITHLA